MRRTPCAGRPERLGAADEVAPRGRRRAGRSPAGCAAAPAPPSPGARTCRSRGSSRAVRRKCVAREPALRGLDAAVGQLLEALRPSPTTTPGATTGSGRTRRSSTTPAPAPAASPWASVECLMPFSGHLPEVGHDRLQHLAHRHPAGLLHVDEHHPVGVGDQHGSHGSLEGGGSAREFAPLSARAVGLRPCQRTPSGRRIAFVVGSGRSGTSTMSGTLQALGHARAAAGGRRRRHQPQGLRRAAVDRGVPRAAAQPGAGADRRRPPAAWFDTGRPAMREIFRNELYDWLEGQFAEAETPAETCRAPASWS